MKKSFCILIITALLAGGCRSPIKPLPPKEGRTYQSILEWAHRSGEPGAVLLVRTPTTNFLGSIGWADTKQKIPMRPDHAFRIGSVTKMFTGIIAAQLAAEGRLNPDLVITNYLPASITSHIRNSGQITVRQLVQHRSGIYNFNASPAYMVRAYLLNPRGEWPVARELEYAYDKPAVFPPGKGWQYSNSNFLLLGQILDQLTGHHHSVEIRNRILTPLGLTHTYYELNEPARGELAHGYERFFGWSQDVTDWTPCTGGCAGMVSTVSDLAVFVRAVAGTNSFLTQPTRQLLRSARAEQPPAETVLPRRVWDLYPVLGYDFGVGAHRGFGDEVPVTQAPYFFGHDGGVPGYFCLAFHEPQYDITIVYVGTSMVQDLLHQQLAIEGPLEEALFGLAVEQTRGAQGPARQ